MIKTTDVFVYQIPFPRIKGGTFKNKIKDVLNINLKGELSMGLYLCSMIFKKDFKLLENKYSFNINGKPSLGKSNIGFSISHTDNYIYVAVVKNENIGIDAEEVKKINMNISREFMSKSELKQLEKTTDKCNYFYRIWTLKESYIKLIGGGIDDDIKKIEFIKKQDGTFHLNEYPVEKIYFTNFSSRGCIVSIASFNKINYKIINFKSINHFLKKYEN